MNLRIASLVGRFAKVACASVFGALVLTPAASAGTVAVTNEATASKGVTPAPDFECSSTRYTTTFSGLVRSGWNLAVPGLQVFGPNGPGTVVIGSLDPDNWVIVGKIGYYRYTATVTGCPEQTVRYEATFPGPTTSYGWDSTSIYWAKQLGLNANPRPSSQWTFNISGFVKAGTNGGTVSFAGPPNLTIVQGALDVANNQRPFTTTLYGFPGTSISFTKMAYPLPSGAPTISSVSLVRDASIHPTI